jgi:hypothetical protein
MTCITMNTYKYLFYRVGLAQLIRFLVVQLTYSGANPKFDIDVIFMTNYSFSWRRCPH